MIRGVAKCGIVVFVLLSACATQPSPNSQLAPNLSPQTLPEAPYFSLTGRLSIRQNDRLDSVKIVWTRNEREERLKFFTPFGSQLAELVKAVQADGSVAVTLNNGSQVTRAASIDDLTEAVLGVALGGDQIARWVQGVGLVENRPQEFRLRDGSVWQVTAERWQSWQDIYRYAGRLTATKIGDEIALKLVVDEWSAK